MIKYKFAYDSQQNIIDIQTLSKANKVDKFKCLGCGHDLVAVLGAKRVKHFRHKVILEINCSSETYLHKLAKTKFYETYQKCLEYNEPFKIKILMQRICDFYETDFLRVCELEPRKDEFDLTRFFKKIYLECKENSFIPDVLLEANSNEKIFFEVVVTHHSSENKINSNYRIIEFKINTEEDIRKIESCLLEESETINFYNFKNMPKGGWCQGKCLHGIVPYAKSTLQYNIFVVYENGKSAFVKETIEDIELLRPKILHFEFISLAKYRDIGSFYRSKVVESYQKGIKIKNCYLCRYHSINQSHYKSGAVFCKFLKNTGSSNMAADCQYFRTDPLVFSQYLNMASVQLAAYVSALKFRKMTVPELKEEFADDISSIEIISECRIITNGEIYEGKGLKLSCRGNLTKLFAFPDGDNPNAAVPNDVFDYLVSFWDVN